MSIKRSTAIKASHLAHCIKAINKMLELDKNDGDWIMIRDKAYVKVHEFIDDLRNEEK